MSNGTAREDFAAAVRTAFPQPQSVHFAPASAVGPDHDPEVQLYVAVNLGALGNFHVEAYRVLDDEDVGHVVDVRGEDEFDLQADFQRLQAMTESPFQTCTFGDAKYVLHILPFGE